MTLAASTAGDPSATPVVLVHGFTQNARCWGPLLPAVAAHHRVIAIDAPGHGDSPAHHDTASFQEAAALVGEVGGAATYVGYSMGGRLCLRLACDRPDLVRRLVLIGATPGLIDAQQRRDRRMADDALATRLLTIGLGPFLDEWLALPLFAGLPLSARHLDARLTNRAEGLAASLRHCGTGSQEPMWDRLASLPMPVLLAAGAEDGAFADVARRMQAACNGAAPPGARAPAELRLIAGAGHTAHLERPDDCSAILLEWLQRTTVAA